MFDPNTSITVTDIISSLRDVGFLVALTITGWKIRSWIQPGIEFFKRLNGFMDRGEHHMQTMEQQMSILLTNHLSHIESDLKHIFDREVSHVMPLRELQATEIEVEPEKEV